MADTNNNQYPLDMGMMYDALDSMTAMKKYRKPTEDYFPSVAEVNTYIYEEAEAIVPYLVWLDSELSPAGREENKEAIKVFQKHLDRLTKEGKLV